MEMEMLLAILFGFLKYFAWMLFLRFLVKNDKLAAILFAIEFAGIAIALDFYDLQIGDISLAVAITVAALNIVIPVVIMAGSWKDQPEPEPGMFSDSTFESGGRIKNKKVFRWAFLTLQANSLILISMILVPLIYPEALPHNAMVTAWTVPPPPPPP